MLSNHLVISRCRVPFISTWQGDICPPASVECLRKRCPAKAGLFVALPQAGTVVASDTPLRLCVFRFNANTSPKEEFVIGRTVDADRAVYVHEVITRYQDANLNFFVGTIAIGNRG